jgi:hypothetical protein
VTLQEVAVVLNSRKLWSAHLLSLEPELKAMVADMAAHHHGLHGLGPLLRRVCAQLVSLSPPTATIVVTAVLSSCHSCLQAKSGTVARRLMAFLAWLVGQPTVKSVVNSLFQEEAPRDVAQSHNIPAHRFLSSSFLFHYLRYKKIITGMDIINDQQT